MIAPGGLCVTDGVTYFDLWLVHNCVCWRLVFEVALKRLQSLWYGVCWMVRRDEPPRDGVISPIYACNTCCRSGTSTAGPNDFGPCGSGNFFLCRSFRDSLYTRTPRYSSLWWKWFHGYVPMVSPACCGVSPMAFDVHVLFWDVIIVDCSFVATLSC